jgi:hypothetical protein
MRFDMDDKKEYVLVTDIGSTTTKGLQIGRASCRERVFRAV